MDSPSGLYDAVIVAVGHDAYRILDVAYFKSLMSDTPILLDLKGLYQIQKEDRVDYWRL